MSLDFGRLDEFEDAYGASTVGASAVASKTPQTWTSKPAGPGASRIGRLDEFEGELTCGASTQTWTSRLAQPYASSRLGQPAASEDSYGASTIGALAVGLADYLLATSWLISFFLDASQIT